jgi:hypothetical protein
MYCRLACIVLLLAGGLAAQSGRPDPEIQKIVAEISRDRISATMKKLGDFGTRSVFSDTDEPDHGIKAARAWIHKELKSYSPRLEVSFQPWKVKKQGRIFRDVELVNVVAVLPGATHPEQRILVTGHYDSLAIVTRDGAADFRASGESATDAMDNEKSAASPAPGVSDDASGTAVVMELARVMSQRKFDKTLVFVAFAGEEVGLVGSTLFADKAKKENQRIEAVFNNDIVGNDVAGDGRAQSGLVRVFSEEPADSPSRELARYVRDAAQRYVPAFRAEIIFRNDRFSRGGDHTPFVANGYAGVRFTTPAENLGVQHTPDDTFDRSSPAYTANVARVNAAAAASLALAPPAPDVNREVLTGANKGRLLPNLSRGKSLYDAVLRWKDSPAEDLAGYLVVMRPTTAAFWEREVFVGKTTEYTFEGLSIDDIVIGVKAIDKDGHESLVSPYIAQVYPRAPIELQ